MAPCRAERPGSTLWSSRAAKVNSPTACLQARRAVGALRSRRYVRAHNAGRVRATNLIARLHTPDRIGSQRVRLAQTFSAITLRIVGLSGQDLGNPVVSVRTRSAKSAT